MSPVAVAANADAVSMDTTSVNKSYIGDLYTQKTLELCATQNIDVAIDIV